MLIECLIKRDGPTEVSHAGMQYIFKSRPDLTGGDTEPKVCEVCADHAIKRFISFKTMYREYLRKETKAVPAKPVVKSAAKAVPAKPFTTEDFFVLTDEAQIKRVIGKCENKETLCAIGAEEHSSTARRQWVIDTLEGRLRELDDKKLPADLLEVLS